MNFFKNRINFKECVFLPSVFHKKANEKNFDLNSLLLFCPPPTSFCKLFTLTEQKLEVWCSSRSIHKKKSLYLIWISMVIPQMMTQYKASLCLVICLAF